jgi:hypothetical protein
MIRASSPEAARADVAAGRGTFVEVTEEASVHDRRAACRMEIALARGLRRALKDGSGA